MASLTIPALWYATLGILQLLVGGRLLLQRRGPFHVLAGALFALNAVGALGWAAFEATGGSQGALRVVHAGDDPTGLVLVLLGLLLFLDKPLDRARWPPALLVATTLVGLVGLVQVALAFSVPDFAATPFSQATVTAPVYIGYSLVLLGLVRLLAQDERPRAAVSWLIVAFGPRVAEFAPPYGKRAFVAVFDGGHPGEAVASFGAFLQLGALAAAALWLAILSFRRAGVQRRRALLPLAALGAFALLGVVEVSPGIDLGAQNVIIATATLYLVRPIAFGLATDRRGLTHAVLWTGAIVLLALALRAIVHLVVGIPMAAIVAADVIVVGLLLVALPLLARPLGRLAARADVLADALGAVDRPRVLVRYVHAAQSLEGDAFVGATREEIASGTSIRAKHVGLVAQKARDRLRVHADGHAAGDPLIEEFDERAARVKKRYRLTPRGMDAAQRMLASD